MALADGKYRQIVDENDNLIGHKWRDEFEPERDIYRVSALWLANSKGETLIAQRAFKKKNGGGLWGPAVAGTLEYDESYKDNIVKEVREEIGVSRVTFSKSKKLFVEADNRRYFCTYFYAVLDKPADEFELEDEVEAVKWVTADWLIEDIKAHPEKYVQGFARNLQRIMDGATE